jgi:hypothetical protein
VTAKDIRRLSAEGFLFVMECPPKVKSYIESTKMGKREEIARSVGERLES